MSDGVGFHSGLHVHDELHLLGRILRIAERYKVIALLCRIIENIHLIRRIITVVRAGFLQGVKDSLLDLFLAALGYPVGLPGFR